MATATAWLLTLGAGTVAAVGERELVHLVEHPRLYPALEQPSYARWRLQWRNAFVPLIDLSALISGRREAADAGPDLVGLFGYHAGDETVSSLGALSLSDVPVRRRVSDEQACALPRSLNTWAPLTHSCFEHEAVVYPIVDLAAIFSRLLPPAPNAGEDGFQPTFQVTEI